ncbi:MAG: 23S rRNA (adenine(2503)-C(2))-methyltransferase RlmN [Myxococcota bacterium]
MAPPVRPVPAEGTEEAKQRPDLRTLSTNQVRSLFDAWGEPSYRADQVLRWVHRRGARSIEEMSDLSKALRGRLAETVTLSSLTIAKCELARDGTRKYAFRSARGDVVESVFIPDASAPGRNSLCISSQVGCAIDCQFCLTASLGLIRNLGPGEIVEQVIRVDEDLRRHGLSQSVNNVVLMGMGEPLANFRSVVDALRLMTSDLGPGLSSRRVTVSTSGLAPRIPRLGEEVPVQLAVSLNATTDDVRDRIMPINKTYPIDVVLDACRRFPLPPRRRITFEYVLLKDINDSDADARRLVRLLKGLRCKVNLIPFNEHPYVPFRRPSLGRVQRFQDLVSASGLSVFVRTPRGDDISAACGQLGVEVDAPKRVLHVLS